MKITIDREVLENVTETLECMANSNWRNWEELASPEEFERWVKSRANSMALTLREALAQPQQEPMGEVTDAVGDAFKCEFKGPLSVGTYLYTSPPAHKPLTVDCIGLALALESQAKRVESQTAQRAMLAAAAGLRNIEAAHGIKESK